MGVNFPDVKYIVHAGPERSLVDYIQAAGRLVEMETMLMMWWFILEISWLNATKVLKNLWKQVAVFGKHYSNISTVMCNQSNPFIIVVQTVQ